MQRGKAWGHCWGVRLAMWGEDWVATEKCASVESRDLVWEMGS